VLLCRFLRSILSQDYQYVWSASMLAQTSQVHTHEMRTIFPYNWLDYACLGDVVNFVCLARVAKVKQVLLP
jgi:hypothetical protein